MTAGSFKSGFTVADMAREMVFVAPRPAQAKVAVRLSVEELRLLALLAEGKTSVDVAGLFGLSVATVRHEPHADVRALFDTVQPSFAMELTPDDVRLLELLGDGWDEQEIARELLVPVKVVSFGVDEVVGKLRARSTLHALAIAFRRGLLPLERRQEGR